MAAGITALGNRRILSVALNSMPQEAQVFGSGRFCSWLLEPSMPGIHSVPDCLSDPLYVPKALQTCVSLSLSHRKEECPWECCRFSK